MTVIRKFTHYTLDEDSLQVRAKDKGNTNIVTLMRIGQDHL